METNAEASEFLVGFLAKFTLLIERELLAIRQNVVTTVEAVMNGIEDISDIVEKNKQDADQILEFTYLRPDPETEVLIEDVQRFADELIDGAYREVHGAGRAEGEAFDPETVMTTTPEMVIRNRLNRFNVKVDDALGRLDNLDNQLSQQVLGIVGALSSEDLIAQRLEHTILSLKSLQTGLSFLLIDYEERCRSDEVERVTKSILTFTFRQYTTEEEKTRFRDVFGMTAA